MQLLLFVAFFLFCAVFVEAQQSSCAIQKHAKWGAFKDWQQKYSHVGKNYDLNCDEMTTRFTHWVHTETDTSLLNTQYNGIATFSTNSLADLTDEESQNRRGFKPNKNSDSKRNVEASTPTAPATPTPLPNEYFNWCDPAGNPQGRSVCSPIKDQGNCGSCWAYTSTTVTESAIALATSTITVASPQQIIDCYVCPSNMGTPCGGCNGGPIAFSYVEQSPLQYTSSYPENSAKTGAANTCSYNTQLGYDTLTQYKGLTTSESSWVSALKSYGPMAIMVSADPSKTWDSYASGVMTAAMCGNTVDHAVTLVGYNGTTSPGYWIIRNSWGPEWGVNGDGGTTTQKGFLFMEYGTNACYVTENEPQGITTASFLGSATSTPTTASVSTPTPTTASVSTPTPTTASVSTPTPTTAPASTPIPAPTQTPTPSSSSTSGGSTSSGSVPTPTHRIHSTTGSSTTSGGSTTSASAPTPTASSSNYPDPACSTSIPTTSCYGSYYGVYCPCIPPPAGYTWSSTSICGPVQGYNVDFCFVNQTTAYVCTPSSTCATIAASAQTVDAHFYGGPDADTDDEIVSIPDKGNTPFLVDSITATPVKPIKVSSDARAMKAKAMADANKNRVNVIKAKATAQPTSTATSSSDDSMFMGMWIAVGIAVGVVATVIVVVVVIVVRKRKSRYV